MCRCSAAQAEERLPSPSCHAKPHANAHQPELMCFLSRCELHAVAFGFIVCEAHAFSHALVSCRASVIILLAVALQLARLKVITRCDKLIEDNSSAGQSS